MAVHRPGIHGGVPVGGPNLDQGECVPNTGQTPWCGIPRSRGKDRGLLNPDQSGRPIKAGCARYPEINRAPPDGEAPRFQRCSGEHLSGPPLRTIQGPASFQKTSAKSCQHPPPRSPDTIIYAAPPNWKRARRTIMDRVTSSTTPRTRMTRGCTPASDAPQLKERNMIGSLNGVVIWTHDLARLKTFYCDVLGLDPHSVRPHFVSFRWGDVRLGLGTHQDVEGQAGGGSSSSGRPRRSTGAAGWQRFWTRTATSFNSSSSRSGAVSCQLSAVSCQLSALHSL